MIIFSSSENLRAYRQVYWALIRSWRNIMIIATYSGVFDKRVGKWMKTPLKYIRSWKKRWEIWWNVLLHFQFSMEQNSLSGGEQKFSIKNKEKMRNISPNHSLFFQLFIITSSVINCFPTFYQMNPYQLIFLPYPRNWNL